MRRVIQTLVVAIMPLVWVVPAAASAEPGPWMGFITYTYAASNYDAPENDTAPDRGPPIKGYLNITYDSVDLRSDGTLSRLSEPGPRATYDYDDTQPLVQGDAVVGTNSAPVWSTDGDLSLLEPPGVAANTGVWSLPSEGGGLNIGGRWYTEHALERMAPNTPEVMAQLETRAVARAQAEGLAPGTREFAIWWADNGPKPCGVPPSVVEAEIADPGTTGVRVITNANGDVVTVWPTG